MTPTPDALEEVVARLKTAVARADEWDLDGDLTMDVPLTIGNVRTLLAALQRRPDREAVADTLRAEVSVLRETLAWIAGHNNVLLSDGAPATRACLDALVSRAGAALLATQPQDQNSGG